MPVLFSRTKAHLLEMLVVFFLVAISAAVILIYLQPVEYKISSSILIRQGKKQGSTDLTAELAVLRSDALAKQVLSAVGAERLYPQPEKTGGLEQFQERFSARPVQGAARIVELSFRHPDAALAVETVSTVIKFLSQELEKLNDPQAALLEEELLLRRKQMQQAQNVLSMFRQNDRLRSDDWQMQYQEIKRGRLEAVLDEEARLEEMLAGELAGLRQQFAALPAGDGASREAFLKMKIYRQELLRKYPPDNPLIVASDRQLALLRQQLQFDKVAEKLADEIAQTSLAHANQQETREAAQRELNQLAANLARQADQKKVFSSLEAEVEQKRELYAQQLNKVEESRKADVKEGYVTVIEPPQPPSEPARPNKPRGIIQATVLGLLASLLWSLLRFRRLV